MTSTPLTIAVIGAGIGGLTAAVALRQAGFDVDVYEQAPELTEVGGGINMGPNAARILYRLGLGDGARPRGRAAGQHAPAALAGWPHAAAGAAQPALRRALRRAAPDRAPRRPALDHRLGLPARSASISATVWSASPTRRSASRPGSTTARAVAADVLVGADGIHSTVRAALLGEEAPRFAGCVAYRGLVPVERIADLGLEIGSQSWVGPGGHFVHYFVSRGRLLNFVGWTEHDTWNREDWTDRATVERALAAFDGWHPQVRRIIAAAETCFVWALFDRDPLPRWSVGRTTLLGDACHPMYPFMGQGAAQAIEDGATLAACLVAGGGDDPAEALRRYERCAGRASPGFRRCRAPTRPASTCRTARRRMARDAEWATAGDRSPERCAGSTGSTPASSQGSDTRICVNSTR